MAGVGGHGGGRAVTSVRTVLVVGGASGIGLASAGALAADGFRVVIADRDLSRLDGAVGELRDKGYLVDGRPMDVTDRVSVSATIGEIAEQSRLHGLVNTAGILQIGSVLEVTEADWDRLIAVNLTGTFLTCKAAVEAMVPSGGGAIVNLASQSGRTKSFYSAPNYVASKAGVIGLTMSIAAQHAADGVRANAVAPGLVETPMIADAYTAEQRARVVAATPLGRFATADEVAEVVVFLVSDRSSYVTGQTINVNGGSFMQ